MNPWQNSHGRTPPKGPSPVGPTIFDQPIPRAGLSFQTSPALPESDSLSVAFAMAIVRDGPGTLPPYFRRSTNWRIAFTSLREPAAGTTVVV